MIQELPEQQNCKLSLSENKSEQVSLSNTISRALSLPRSSVSPKTGMSPSHGIASVCLSSLSCSLASFNLPMEIKVTTSVVLHSVGFPSTFPTVSKGVEDGGIFFTFSPINTYYHTDLKFSTVSSGSLKMNR